MGPGNVLTPDVEIPGVPDRRARGVRRVLVVCSGPLQRPRHAAHGHGSAPPMRRSVAVVIADTHIYAHFYNIGPKYPCLAKNRTTDPSTDHPGGPDACRDRGRGGGRCVGGRSGSGDARQARRCGCSWISDFRGVPGGWLGIPKSKSTVHGDYRVVSDPPQVAGHSLGGCRKFSEISGNCRQLPEISDATLERQVFQSWAVWCSLRNFRIVCAFN